MSSLATFISFDPAADDLAQTHWLWHGLVAAGKVTLFTSLWKSGKTTLLAHFLARRQAGGEFLGLAVAPGGSLVVSEEPRDLWPARCRRLGMGAGLGVLTGRSPADRRWPTFGSCMTRSWSCGNSGRWTWWCSTRWRSSCRPTRRTTLV